jgi:hypothetical protein
MPNGFHTGNDAHYNAMAKNAQRAAAKPVKPEPEEVVPEQVNNTSWFGKSRKPATGRRAAPRDPKKKKVIWKVGRMQLVMPPSRV